MHSLLVVAGPSGVGKGTLLKLLRARYPEFEVLVSHTTRQPRAGEVDGREYYFVTEEKFNAMKERGEFVETACFSGNHYGTSVAEILRIGRERKRGILEIELIGVSQVQKNDKIEAKYVFLKPPSRAVLEARLRARGTDDETAIQRRLDTSDRELAMMERLYCDHVIINDDLDQAFADLCAFVQTTFFSDDA